MSQVLPPDPIPVEIDEDGFILDTHGEVIGHIRDNKPTFDKNPELFKSLTSIDVFTVSDRSSAEWVLEKIAAQEAKQAAVELRRKAINANMDAQAKKSASRAAWLRQRFGAELEAFARAELAAENAGRKRAVKTLVLDNGRVSFRTTPGTARITDMAKAVEWLRWWDAIEAIKVTETVVVSKAVQVVEAMIENAKTGEESGRFTIGTMERMQADVAAFLERTGPRETCKIVTGVESAD